ncbi:phosphatase PAP2 family protein [Halobiforma nitratireducens]|uniref:PA-phosphatase-like phosphoesterase n=1 Tax=Halobiforma nitratireducens JCM 10879 TaxID=1227454 RepID=M0M938_9EURY|nr:phosphatase PAP2 family protein [Halobiforma nitratireducens]EMA41858.1 PA-phosphatase-like phosphoesterase [Halobiforma nitratireducens JCM 10879]
MSEQRELPTVLFDPELNRAISEALPQIVVEAFGVVTTLGDGATLVAVAALLYWFGEEADRHDRAMVLAVAVATLSLVAGLKGIFEVPRPLYVAEPPLEFAPAEYPGWSTPSAHAMGAAAVYGALAVVMDVGTRRQRYAVAGALIVTIPLSRVVIGVHYLGDVIIGAVLGLLLVAVALRITKRSITPMFALSLVIAVAAFVLGSEEFTTMAIGASLGGLVTWPLLENRQADPLGASVLLLGLLVLPLLAAVRLLDLLIAVEGGFVIAGSVTVSLAAIIETAGFALAFGGAIAVPYIASQFDDTEAVQKLQTHLPFRGRHVEPAATGDEPSPDERTEF